MSATVGKDKRHLQRRALLLCLLIVFCFPLVTIAQSYKEQRRSFASSAEERIAAIHNIKSFIEKGKELSAYYPDSASLILKQTLRSSYKHSYADGVFESLLMLGILSSDKGDYKNSITLYEKALSITSATSNPALSACRTLNNLANTYNFLGDFEQSVANYFKAVKHGEAAPDGASQLSRVYANLAGALSTNGQTDKAFTYLDRAWGIASKANDSSQMMHVLVNKGTVYERGGNDIAALKSYRVAQTLAEGSISIKPEEQFFCLNNIASILIANDHAADAVPYLIKARDIKRLTSVEQAAVLYSLGSAYYSLEKDDEAIQVLQQLLQLAQQKQIKQYQANAHELLAELYAAHRNYEKAFIHNKAYSLLNDTLKDIQTQNSIGELEVRYEVSEKNNKIAQNQLLISKQKQRLASKDKIIIGTACIVGLSILLSIGFYKAQKHQLEINSLKAGIEGEERERKRLAQDLHDGIGSTLVSATMEFTAFRNEHPTLFHEPKYDEALERLNYIYKELRRVAHNLTPDILLEHGLVDTLSLFCEQIFNNRNIEIDFEAYGAFTTLEPKLTLSIYRIVQEMLHNVVKHSNSTHCLVQLHHHEHLLSVLVEDNGVGFVPEKTAHGIGLKNLDARVQALNGQVEIYSSAEKGTSIYLNFDLKTSKKARAV